MRIRREIWMPVVAGVALVLVVAGGLIFLKESCRDFDEDTLTIDGAEYNIAIARDAVSQARGLIGCEHIPEKSGMYFPYSEPRMPAFWMKGMSIPIDIIWIYNGKVVGIEENVPPVEKFATDPPRYRPPRSVTGVFEIGAGKAAEYDITFGSLVTAPGS